MTSILIIIFDDLQRRDICNDVILRHVAGVKRHSLDIPIPHSLPSDLSCHFIIHRHRHIIALIDSVSRFTISSSSVCSRQDVTFSEIVVRVIHVGLKMILPRFRVTAYTVSLPGEITIITTLSLALFPSPLVVSISIPVAQYISRNSVPETPSRDFPLYPIHTVCITFALLWLSGNASVSRGPPEVCLT